MPKLSKRIVDAAHPTDKDYVVWDDELPGFGLRVFASGKRSYIIQYRALGRSRRYTIGPHGVWTPEMARQQAKVQLGKIAQGDNPAEERLIDRQATTVKELCQMYLADLDAGLVLGKGGIHNLKSVPLVLTGTAATIGRNVHEFAGLVQISPNTLASRRNAIYDNGLYDQYICVQQGAVSYKLWLGRKSMAHNRAGSRLGGCGPLQQLRSKVVHFFSRFNLSICRSGWLIALQIPNNAVLVLDFRYRRQPQELLSSPRKLQRQTQLLRPIINCQSKSGRANYASNIQFCS